MEVLKFALFSVVVLALLGLGSYWAVATIQTGSEHASTEKIKKLENDNESLKKEMADSKSEISRLQQEVQDEKEVQNMPEPNVVISVPAPVTVYKNQALINELQKLINDKVVIKLKSRGTRVGTLQKFLNIYNKTSNKIDNDFGANMQNALIAFQKEQGLAGDGEAGGTTFSKMIDWLKKQG